MRTRRAFPSARTTWSFPSTKEKLVNETRELAKEYEQQYIDGLITQGEKYNKVVDAWAKCTDQVAEEMMKQISSVADRREDRPREAGQLDLHDEPLGCARVAGPDEAARRHARPDGQAVGRDHRDADHLQLQGRPVGARVLQLDPRRPQGPGRHRAQDRQLGLSDAPAGGRGPGLHHHGGRLRHRGVRSPRVRSSMRARSSPRWARGCSAAPPPSDVKDPASGELIVAAGDEILEDACREDRDGRALGICASARC